MDKSRIEPTIFLIEKISFSLKLFSGHFYGQSFIKTVRGPWHFLHTFSGFEFYEWMYNQRFDVTALSSTEVSIYLEYISVAPYILEEACDRRSYPYTTRQNRWKNGR